MEGARDKQHGGETNTGATHQNPLLFFVDWLAKTVSAGRDLNVPRR
jgi:hypothetical protein